MFSIYVNSDGWRLGSCGGNVLKFSRALGWLELSAVSG